MGTSSELAFTGSNFKALQDYNARLLKALTLAREEISALRSQVKEFKDRLNKDSHNSSKPPCSDGLKKKPVNLRKPTNKQPGGQPGHKGHTLKLEGEPDQY